MDIVVRAVFLYIFVVFVMRVVGRRELSSMTPFDLILLIVVGDALQQGLTQDDYSVTGTVLPSRRLQRSRSSPHTSPSAHVVRANCSRGSPSWSSRKENWSITTSNASE